jgi:hypothetical protein
VQNHQPLPFLRIRHAGDGKCRLARAGQLLQFLLHLEVRHHFAAQLAEATQAVGDLQEAILVERGDVAGLIPALAQDLGLSTDSGVYVTLVATGSPAQAAGLRGAFRSETQAAQSTSVPSGGDVIVAVDGKAVANVDELADYLDTQKRVGDTVVLTVLRNGAFRTAYGDLPPLATPAAVTREVEALRPSLDPVSSVAMEQAAREEGLLITGGSDWHGGTRPALGSWFVTEHHVGAFLERVGISAS